MKGMKIENYWLYHLPNINTPCGTQVTTGTGYLLSVHCWTSAAARPLVSSGHV